MVDRLTDRSRGARTPPSSAPGGPRPGAARTWRPAIADRYRRDVRRTSAEPLEASWSPSTGGPRGEGPRRRRPRSWLSRVLDAYGWRVYALPILLVLTVFVVMDGPAGEPAAQDAGQAADARETVAAPEPRTVKKAPVVTESPAEPVDVDIPTAELPPGGAYTKSGKGTWHLVPGSGKVVGAGGEIYRYTVEIEDGIDPSSYGGDDAFAAIVDATLADPRSWTGKGTVRLQRVSDRAAADFKVSLTTPNTNHRPDMCGFTIEYEASCFRRGEHQRVLVNLARWVRGAQSFNADMTAYRQYAINHEVGHVLGNGHVGCAEDGALAPVMMQQSFGVANDYVAKLNAANPSNYRAVPTDGKVCRPNAWPNPTAR